MKTLLFVHGFNCSGTIFSHLISQLPKHRAVFVEYNSSESLSASIQTALEECPNKPFSIIGHSLGGIIGHYVAQQNPLVENLVSISTPFGGSDIASKLHWFYPRIKVFKDISPSSDWIRDLKKAELSCPFLSIVSIAGGLPMISEENDGVVTVESQRSIPCTRRVDVNVNHFEAVQHQTTIKEITKFLFA